MFMPLRETIKNIESGRRLAIAGDEKLLLDLPKGNWIGGTIPYFMAEDGGKISKDKVYVHDFTDLSLDAIIKSYGVNDLPKINEDAPDHGFSIIIIPAISSAHVAYSQDAPNYPNFFMKPILGWISGVHLDDLGKISPKTFNGLTGESSDKNAVVIHCPVAEDKTPIVNIINLFKQGNGDTIKFEESGFSVKSCLINGKKLNFAEYIKNNNIDTRLPMVADYCGAMVNVSFQGVRESDGIVDLYAPVFDGVEYKIAAPVGDYVDAFKKVLPRDVYPVFSCNCILNFLYSELEGKSVEKMYGPITFGEIAYQLLNQTLVYLEIK
jgi:hypothetical protein